MTKHEKPRAQLAPDKAPLTASQATALASLTGIDAGKFKGRSVAEISAEYRWQINPNFFLFTKVCGKVVKPNPVTGHQDPVPFATVYADDTVCSLFGLFPVLNPWAWFFPFDCHTEQVGVTTTDPCGNFCFWLPNFMIEYVLRFRIEHVCYLQLFQKPTVASVIAYLQGNPIGPDPGPVEQVNLTPGTALYRKAEQLLGAQLVSQLAKAAPSNALGSDNTAQKALLAQPAFTTALPPALPKEFRTPVKNASREQHAAAVRATLANKLGLDVNQIAGLNPNRYFGPFLRCYDVLVPEWVPIQAVPDVTFRVTQDVNGTGTQEVIYDGGLFDIPWGTGNPSNVTLIASQIATASTTCTTPNVVCEDVPALQYVGLMPLVNPLLGETYIDPVAGYATRPNPPHPGGTFAEAGVPPSTAPYCGTLQLYGCTYIDGAVYYRLRFTYTAPSTVTPSALTPFTGISWPLYLEVGGVLQEQWPVADANGWYPVIDPSIGWFPGNMVLEWPTYNYADGLYTVQLEIGDGAKNTIATSAAVGFMIDNSIPKVTFFNAIWSFNSDMSGSQSVNVNDCAAIDRGVTPQDVYIQVSYTATASHLRTVELSSGGCTGGATLYPVATTPAQIAAQLATIQHWYEDAGDNTVSNVATYKIAASLPQGVYSFAVEADSRAFNPAGSDGGPFADWNYSPVYIWTVPSFAIAVVNA